MSQPLVSRSRFFQFGFLIILLFISVGFYLQWQQMISQIIEWQKVFHSLLAKHMNAISQNPLNHGLALIALSFGYGVFHAVGPGHGKAVIVTYLSTHKESLVKGVTISLCAALLQSVVAIVLVGILAKVLSIKFSDINDYGNDITTVSYMLVMLLGLFLFSTALTRLLGRRRKTRLPQHHDSHDHSHHDSHDHACCHGHHVHQPAPAQSLLQSVTVILSMGVRPCAGAIVVLIYAHLVDAFHYGVLATLVMGLGTGISIAGIAVGTQLARHWFEKRVNTSENTVVSRINYTLWLRIAGGLIIFLLGLSLFQAAMQAGGDHPLL